jgi:hypothetical protein
MPQLNGLDAARHLKRSVPKAKLLFMTMNEDPDMVGEAFRAGGWAFLLKQAAAFVSLNRSCSSATFFTALYGTIRALVGEYVLWWSERPVRPRAFSFPAQFRRS